MSTHRVAAVKGLIAELGAGDYRHRVGGTRWKVQAPAGATPPPTLLLTLDLSDPRLGLGTPPPEVPLCTRLDGDGMERQHYVFDDVTRTVVFEGPRGTCRTTRMILSGPRCPNETSAFARVAG